MPNTQGDEPTLEELETQVTEQIETSNQPEAEQDEPVEDEPEETQEKLLAGKYKSVEELEKAYKNAEKKLGDSSERFPPEVINAVLDENPGMTRKQAAKQLQDGIIRELQRNKLDQEETTEEVKPPDDIQEIKAYIRTEKFTKEFPDAKGAVPVLSKLSKLPEYRGMDYAEIYEHPDNSSLRELYMESANAMTVGGSTPSKTRTLPTAEKIEQMGKDPNVKPEELESLLADMVGNSKF